MSINESTFLQYKVCVNIRRGYIDRRRPMTVGIEFLDLRPFLRNFRLTYLRYDVYRGIPDFRGWLCRLQPGPAGHAMQYVTGRTGVSRSYI